MNSYNTNIHESALVGIANGIAIAANIVKQTLGPKGRNVVIEEKFPPFHRITNDGATIIEAMEMQDPLEKMGLGFLKEVVARSNQNSGDGSTTTCLIVDAILKEGSKTGISGMEIKKSLDSMLQVVEKSIDDQTKQITPKDIYSVALISGEDEELAKKLQEVYEVIGSNGIIHLDNSNTFDTTYSLVDGVRFTGTGYLSPYMVYEEDKRKNNQKETKAVYYKPTILVTKKKISHVNDINPLLETMFSQGKKDLVIFTDDMDSNVASFMIASHRQKVMNILIIKAPIMWKDHVFEDFAKITGSTIIEDSSGISSFKDLPLSALGTCGKIVVDKEETIITGIADISEHLKELKEEGSNDSQRRLSWLQTKTAILKLGANSETELSYKRLKAEDAINSCQKALQYGVVAGGGATLCKIANSMPDTIGGNILREALKAPIRQIVKNAGYTETLSYEFIGDRGFDAKTGEIVDMMKVGIIDAAKVVKQAVRNAIGVSSTILTASSVITLPPKDQALQLHELLQNKPVMF